VECQDQCQCQASLVPVEPVEQVEQEQLEWEAWAEWVALEEWTRS
jgi:hypothetical protein